MGVGREGRGVITGLGGGYPDGAGPGRAGSRGGGAASAEKWCRRSDASILVSSHDAVPDGEVDAVVDVGSAVGVVAGVDLGRNEQPGEGRHVSNASSSAVDHRDPEVGEEDVADHPAEGERDQKAREEYGQVPDDDHVHHMYAGPGEGIHLDLGTFSNFVFVVLLMKKVEFFYMKGTVAPIEEKIAEEEVCYKMVHAIQACSRFAVFFLHE